jgi:cytochrome c-type biogenesis protein CcmF
MDPGILGTWLAFAAAIASGLLYLAAGSGRERFRPWADWAFRAQTAVLLGLVAWLWHLLAAHQFQYAYVAAYTSRDLRPEYLIAALWGGQQGTFLLWAAWTALVGCVLARSRSQLAPTAMFLLNCVQVFLLLILVIEGPFRIHLPAPLDGNGLNPLLQDYWMTIHPPMLFLGYASLIVPYALALAALAHRDSAAWLELAPPWSLFSTLVLAAGFTMGGLWAYKVLGWGGFWGWDPVENASLVPWLMNAALFHGLLVERATGTLRRTNLFLGTVPFLFVLYGSFLTRSGVLADFSVHSFVDLGLNGYLIVFLASFTLVGWGLWAARARHFAAPGATVASLSREFALWLGMLTFLLMGVLTMLGTSAPLVSRLFGPPSSVQTTYYSLVNGLLGILLALLAGIAPLMRWRVDAARRLGPRLAVPLILALAVLTVGALAGVRGAVALALLGSAAFALASNAALAARTLRRGPAPAAAYVSHVGVAVLLVGVVALSQLGRRLPVELPLGQPRSLLGYRFEYRGRRAEADGHAHAVIAVSGRGRRFEAHTPIWYSEYDRGVMRAPHVERFWDGDLYISPVAVLSAGRGGPEAALDPGESRGPGDPAAPEALAVEISTKPLILLVWAGMGITLVGALLAILRRTRGPGSLPAPNA